MKKLRYIIALILVIGLCACGGSAKYDDLSLEELLDLGTKYLQEENYKEAVIVFEKAIEIDEKCAQAYIGLADAYICIEEYDKAEDILKRGYELTRDEKIKEMLDSLESGQLKTSDGLVRRMNHYNEKNELDWYITYTYDNQNRESLVTSFDGNGNQTGQVQCEYDEQGNQITGYHYGYDGSFGWMKYEYDNLGYCVKILYDFGSYWVYNYDENGNQTSIIMYSEDGEKTGSSVYEYEGNLKIVKDYDGNGNFQEKQVLEYDDNGLLISYSSYWGDNSLNWKKVYSYDKDGKRISETKYDGNGNITGKTEYDQ